MGQAQQRKSRLARMLAEQPCCVYCGGERPGSSVDHMPPIGVCDDRLRPVGMEFIACKECHDGTRKPDQVAGLFSESVSQLDLTDRARADCKDFCRSPQQPARSVQRTATDSRAASVCSKCDRRHDQRRRGVQRRRQDAPADHAVRCARCLGTSLSPDQQRRAQDRGGMGRLAHE